MNSFSEFLSGSGLCGTCELTMDQHGLQSLVLC